MAGVAKSVQLKSCEGNGSADGTRVDVSWTLERSGDAQRTYRARDVRIVVHADPAIAWRAVDIHLLERHPRTGLVWSDIRRTLESNGAGQETVFDWHSSGAIPEQELHVALKPVHGEEPEIRLQDPISRRFNFLIALGG
jgi:hypothetical protein